VIATVGDGAYFFGEPLSCLFVQRAHVVPILTVVFNKQQWEAVKSGTLAVHPTGAAKTRDSFPLSELRPAPRFEEMARTVDGYGERVENPEELPAALKRGLAAVREGHPQRAMPARYLEDDKPSPRYSAGRACRRLAYGAAREALIPLLLFSSLIMSGCASMLPPPPKPIVTLTTAHATTYYSVRGTTTSKIFEEIDAQGLRDQDGERAAGLASAKSAMAWTARATGALCTPQSVTITLDLVVTLPRHERLNDLSNGLRQRWEHLAAAIAAHEQRHVDIFMDGANAVKSRIEAVLKKWASCADVETSLRSLWTSQEVETEKAQRGFDVADSARLDLDRKPLQAAIDTARAKLAALTAEIRQLDAALDDLVRRAAAVRENIDAVNVDIAKANGSCSRPTDRVVARCRQYNALATGHDALVAEHSSVVAHRNRLAGEHNALVESISELIETLNWVR